MEIQQFPLTQKCLEIRGLLIFAFLNMCGKIRPLGKTV